ncbi:type VI secretion system TssO [Danxiaibacter flavus]|uniref:Type VI secretion system TssO n=1 Tax=Danxiaibacter flavus TaxID=3049108 RepID=A0ABV3ZCR2_9BACT|nr:type VI secretion system TssO [Chitinophagaceae bacterium DXS]
MERDNLITLGRREKRQYLIYLVCIFVFTVSLLVWIIFRNSNNPFTSKSIVENAYLKKARAFDERKKYASALFDSTFERITALQNGTLNTIVEADITSQVKELNDLADDVTVHDIRYASFRQMAAFLTSYFEDMLTLKRKVANVQMFQKQLTDCEIGYKDGEILMNQLRAAQAARAN